jgi:hypothetical protein
VGHLVPEEGVLLVAHKFVLPIVVNPVLQVLALQLVERLAL